MITKSFSLPRRKYSFEEINPGIGDLLNPSQVKNIIPPSQTGFLDRFPCPYETKGEEQYLKGKCMP